MQEPNKQGAVVFTPKYMDELPQDCEQGILYVSRKFGISTHSCPCGCGHKVVLNFKPEWSDGWDLIEEESFVTFRPSILNAGMPCRSHYFITHNTVEWC